MRKDIIIDPFFLSQSSEYSCEVDSQDSHSHLMVIKLTHTRISIECVVGMSGSLLSIWIYRQEVTHNQFSAVFFTQLPGSRHVIRTNSWRWDARLHASDSPLDISLIAHAITALCSYISNTSTLSSPNMSYEINQPRGMRHWCVHNALTLAISWFISLRHPYSSFPVLRISSSAYGSSSAQSPLSWFVLIHGTGSEPQ